MLTCIGMKPFANRQNMKRKALTADNYSYDEGCRYLSDRNMHYAVICLSFLRRANITMALIRQSAIRIPQLYIKGILFHSIEGMELR